MPQFSYTAVNKDGERLKGNMEAPNESEVRVMLRAQSLRPIRITKAGTLDVDLFTSFGGGISHIEILLFTRQLSILVTSGIPLVQGLEIISAQVSPSMKKIILAVREKVTGGSFLWEALRSHKNAFPDIYVSMIRAGESAGALDTILKRLIKYLEDAYKLRQMMRGAMIYPIAIVGVGLSVTLILMIFVIPKFEELLKGSGQELPGPTQFVIDVSHFFQHNAGFMLVGAVVGGFLLVRYARTNEGSSFIDFYVLKMPFFGPIFLKIALARFARTMQTLLSSGINLLDALDITRDAIGNKTIADNLTKVRIDVEQGKTLAGVMAKLPLFPSMVIQMVTVGESTGNIDKMLERVAEFYEQEVDSIVANLSKLIEPFILVFLGTLVGGLMIAMYLPIFKMAGGAG